MSEQTPAARYRSNLQGEMDSAGRSNAANRYTVAELIDMRDLMVELGLPLAARHTVPTVPWPDPDGPHHQPPVLRLILSHVED